MTMRKRLHLPTTLFAGRIAAASSPRPTAAKRQTRRPVRPSRPSQIPPPPQTRARAESSWPADRQGPIVRCQQLQTANKEFVSGEEGLRLIVAGRLAPLVDNWELSVGGARITSEILPCLDNRYSSWRQGDAGIARRSTIVAERQPAGKRVKARIDAMAGNGRVGQPTWTR